MADSHGDGISDRFFLANTIVGPQMDFSSFGSTSAIRGVRSEDWKPWEGKGPATGGWYSLVDSLRTSLTKTAEWNQDEIGELANLVGAQN